MKSALQKCAVAVTLLIPLLAVAQGVAVRDAWVRGTLPGQTATGAYMALTASADGVVVSVSSPLARIAEIHRMVLEDNVMKMRAVPGLKLPAGRTVEMKPGGYHLMLMDLTRALREGESVPVILTVESADGSRNAVHFAAVVRAANASADDALR
jgi:periplasmic copper chaperone A